MAKVTKETVEKTVASVKETAGTAIESAKVTAGTALENAKVTARKTRVRAKSTAEKAAATTEKAAAAARKKIVKEYAKVALKESYVQFAGSEYSQSEILEKVEAAFVAEGHKLSTMRELKLYVKPEEKAAYYVVNDKFAGKVEL